MSQGNNDFALKLWRSKPHTWIHATILLQPFLFLRSQRLMVSFSEYFLTIYSELKLSAVHLQNPCSFCEPCLLTSNPKSRIRSISTTSAHLRMQNSEQEENALQQRCSPPSRALASLSPHHRLVFPSTTWLLQQWGLPATA